MRFAVFLFFLFVTGWHAAWGQFSQSLRYEREQKNSDNAWIVISMREQGLALVRDRDEYKEGKRLFEIITLDTTFQQTSTTELELKNRLQLIGYDYAQPWLYLLFRQGETDDGDLTLYSVSTVSGEIVPTEIKHEFNFKLTHFSVANKTAIFGGYVNREPAVLIFTPSDNQLKVVPGFFTSETELLDLRVNQNGTFNTLVTNRSLRSNKSLTLRTFDQQGTQLLEDVIEIEQTKIILTGITSTLVRDELLIAGTYSAGLSKQASGIYTVLVDPFKDQPINYYDFGQLQHAFDYLNPKRASKLIEHSRRDREKGKDPDFRSYASSVRLDEFDDGFILLTELYNMSSGINSFAYPTYPYGTPYGYYPFTPYANRYYNSPYSYYNPTQNSDVTVVASTVAVFNAQGKLEWDHSLKPNAKKKPSLEQSSDFWNTANKVVLVNKQESEIVAHARFKNEETQSDTLKILLKNPGDVVRSESKEDEGLRFWYNKSFYVWGYQSLKDPSVASEDRNRSVFYIVKLDVD